MALSTEINLPKIFGDRLLEIPDYQRPYAWQEKQLEDLWEDLDLMGPRGSHYSGTLVVQEIKDPQGEAESMDDAGNTLKISHVVDGQQRLTTCVILLDRIRRQLEVLAESQVEDALGKAKNIREKYCFVTINKVEKPRLRLGKDLNSFWESTILGDEPAALPFLLMGQQNLKDAVDFFDYKLLTSLSSLSNEDQLLLLSDLSRRVTNGLGFLVYEVQSSSEVGVIFETVNGRGRDLTDLEKTKNYLLYLASHLPDDRAEDLALQINEAWSMIFVNLASQGTGSDDQLLRAHWLATENPDKRFWKRMESIKAKFDRGHYIPGSSRLLANVSAGIDQEEAWDKLTGELTEYIDGLKFSSTYFSEMFNPQAEFVDFIDPETVPIVRARSAALGRSEVMAPFRPLLLAARLKFPSDGAFYADLLELCEIYSARAFTILGSRTNYGEARLLRIAYQLFSDSFPAGEGDSKPAAISALRRLIWKNTSDDKVRKVLGDVTGNWYSQHNHKYFLYEYELSLLAEDEDALPFSVFTEPLKRRQTTEHILPQKPDKNAQCWWDSFSRDEHNDYCHSLGNLVLTLDNSSYSNNCFLKKRGMPLAPGVVADTCYSQGKLHQERQLATKEEWTKETITIRQHDLTLWALERWPAAQINDSQFLEVAEEIEEEYSEET
jgi:hypothetical protein